MNNLIKIAFLTPEYPHDHTGRSGGIGTSIKNLATGLLAEGCKVRVLVYGQNKDGLFDDNGIAVQQIKNIKFKGLSWFLTRKKLERIINDLFDDKQIDVVEAADWTGITSFITPKECPVIIRLNGSDTYFCHLDQRPVKWINKFHEKRALEKADGLLAVSQFTTDLTNEVFNFDKKFTIIPNGIDIEKFKSNFTQNDSNIPNFESNQILYFGSLIRKKGLLELPLIFNQVVLKIPNAKLKLIGKDVPDIISGNSSTWKMMQPLFTKEALAQVEFTGSIPYQEIKNHIEKAAVCVFPSFAEALPVSWIEAMAMEKAIVASTIGWANEVIDNQENGFLVSPTNHLKYANRITDLLENTKLQAQFGRAARKKVLEKFSIEIVAKQSISFYKTVTKKF
jgi:glycosyltransferase involved in cell wall biosynthesis